MKRIVWVRILMCLAGLPLAAIAACSETTIAVDNETSRTGLAGAVHSSDGYEGTLPDDIVSLPSLCGGLEEAIKSRSGLGDELLARGLVDAIPVSSATQLGTIGTIHCYSDDIEGKIAILLLNESRETSIVIANDEGWANYTRSISDDDGNPVFPQRYQFNILSGTLDAGNEVIHIDSLMQSMK